MAYQEKLEKTMFILLGFMYERKPLPDTNDYYKFLPDKYKEYFCDAFDSLLREGWIGGIDISTQSDGYERRQSPYMTQEGREWFASQKPLQKWVKVLEFVLKFKP